MSALGPGPAWIAPRSMAPRVSRVLPSKTPRASCALYSVWARTVSRRYYYRTRPAIRSGVHHSIGATDPWCEAFMRANVETGTAPLAGCGMR